ncbi:MAG: hypothetical protein H7039_08975 [Bryobacteraceae bacterium]|nr:hypothetical protein [Bryobacteraceae bacterium]
MAKRKTWKEKLDIGRGPKLVRLEKPFAGLKPGTVLLVPNPVVVKEYIDAIPDGQTITVEQMRRDLAFQHGAEATCPTSTGIFLRIIREAAAEDEAAGLPATPVHRLVKTLH